MNDRQKSPALHSVPPHRYLEINAGTVSFLESILFSVLTSSFQPQDVPYCGESHTMAHAQWLPSLCIRGTFVHYYVSTNCWCHIVSIECLLSRICTIWCRHFSLHVVEHPGSRMLRGAWYCCRRWNDCEIFFMHLVVCAFISS